MECRSDGVRFVLSAGKMPLEFPRGAESLAPDVRARLREEPKIRCELLGVSDPVMRRLLAREGLIPYKHTGTREFVCVWCDLVVGKFETKEDLSNYVRFHKRWDCERPKQKDTSDDDPTLVRLRVARSEGMLETDGT